MSPVLEEMKSKIDSLPENEQVELANYLWNRLGPTDPELHPAWDDELQRRLEEVEAGKAVIIPLEKAMAELREEYP